MRNKISVDRIHRFLEHRGFKKFHTSSALGLHMRNLPTQGNKLASLCRSFFTFETRRISLKPMTSFASLAASRYLYATSSVTEETSSKSVGAFDDFDGDVDPIDLWEEEDEAEPKIGDGGDGGGVVLENCPWGEVVLSVAQNVLEQSGEDMELYAFKTSPRGYIYVRLDKLSHEFGCPTMEEIESFSREYKKKLDEVGATGEIPDDLALEVSSPGVERLLKVPDDLLRFRDVPMIVSYIEYSDASCREKSGVYFLDSIEAESESCIWKLADVKENREPSAKGRPLSLPAMVQAPSYTPVTTGLKVLISNSNHDQSTG
ncbi:hypothetical protein F511_34810 [Dorcoceras hygrometricum]|uniref:Uncharacterized protein n=1 Tax=Dorcoceras hygrometricum TaxID=472368 RepID=A0A2Z7BXK9_9LAMI|nr:hypothetical protein F511_34810 [Dorcoceras hygrometricum]